MYGFDSSPKKNLNDVHQVMESPQTAEARVLSITLQEVQAPRMRNHSLTTSLEISITPLMGVLDLVQGPRLMYNTVSRLLLLGPSLFFSDCLDQVV